MMDAVTHRRFELEKDAYPDLPLMMLITLDALRQLGGSANIQELLDHVIEQEGITEEEQAYLMPNGRDRRLNYYLSWSRTYLKRGDALENSSRGVWALTEVGEKINSVTETREIYDRVWSEERDRAKAKRNAEKINTSSCECADVEADPMPVSNGDEAWRDELLSELLNIAPDAFERLSQRLLREAGFVKVEVRGKSHDGGIDGVGILRVNLVSFQVYFQCKRWSGSVGSKEIRDFRGALQGRADKGLFITTGNFTKQASDEATRDGATAIDLIDGERLCELLKQFELGVKTETVERVTVLSDWLKEI